MGGDRGAGVGADVELLVATDGETTGVGILLAWPPTA